MLLNQRTADGIRRGEVTLAFRRWSAPRVKPGGSFLSQVGMVLVGSVDEVSDATPEEARAAGASSVDEVVGGRTELPLYRIGLSWGGPDPRHALSADTSFTVEQLTDLAATFARWDARTPPWTRQTLELIRDRPGTRAPDLAASVGRETAPFKRDVRRLKELGLTHSLEVGYRLSPRGQAYLDRRDAGPSSR
ncbi:ASCH domain-containing protein [Cellulomonas sp. URHB0016]